jgi:hypothetical protein
MPHDSALPLFYWLVFGCYEPLLTIGGAVGALLYPKEVSSELEALWWRIVGPLTSHHPQTYLQQAPWPKDSYPNEPLAKATIVTLFQLAHTVALLGAINLFVLWTVRKHLWPQPAIQERVVRALLTPLLLADFLHIVLTLWALGEDRWDVAEWGGILWVTIISGFTLMIPRIAWHLGIGRYVAMRDGKVVIKN